MALFGRKDKAPEPFAVPENEGAWTVAQGERDAKPLILRMNEEAPTVGRGRFPFRFGVAGRCRKPRSDGLPGERDLEPLARIEDAVERALPDDGGVLAFVVTTVVQLAWGAYALARPRRWVAVLGVLTGGAALAGWVVAKVHGIGFINGLDDIEPVQLAD